MLRFWTLATLVPVVALAGAASAEDTTLTAYISGPPPQYAPLQELCRVTNNVYERGWSMLKLSCQDFYARIISAGGLDVRAGVYVCWALDPCGWPK